jgi:hypothetical protein
MGGPERDCGRRRVSGVKEGLSSSELAACGLFIGHNRSAPERRQQQAQQIRNQCIFHGGSFSRFNRRSLSSTFYFLKTKRLSLYSAFYNNSIQNIFSFFLYRDEIDCPHPGWCRPISFHYLFLSIEIHSCERYHFFLMSRIFNRFSGIQTVLAIAIFLSGCLNPQNRWTRGNIGVVLLDNDNSVAIEQILPQFASPRDGFLPGDIIVTVDGTSMAGIPAEGVEQALSGPVGGSVNILLQRGDELREYSVTRIMTQNPSKNHLRSRLIRVTRQIEDDSLSPPASGNAVDEAL